MSDFHLGYLYSLSPIHCGGEGDLGNVLDIVREAHTDFPYIPGSSLRGSLRNDLANLDQSVANTWFGKELDSAGQMGVHQVWFGDARLLWIPMRTLSLAGQGNIFTWVSCHSLIRDHANLVNLDCPEFSNQAVGIRAGNYSVADAQINVLAMSDEQKAICSLVSNFPQQLQSTVETNWSNNRIVLCDSDFYTLMEHSLWTQIRNKIQDGDGINPEGAAEVFWTDICIPRDTIFYFPWGYNILTNSSLTKEDHTILISILQGLIQVGGQANVGRGWVKSWINNSASPITVVN
ncbi:type III-B CRISPR module RAMP protein Cmr4 [Synechocystis salina]|uniref:Type III-B CRISPR module RAMP protein Cmr4 n=1 Tax=Synechocystis salina LEGE 00031 TaxID=1828736 RepID=A0ABR9VSZ3_9SYNC|nr:type III-B CRISPR module RAMP protein Cmr4 [Synechocystis salina]MBE9242217.1 type III-B CRISPR module RAMP protein Cmr4 [Synechocystis salina LEGE 00041]MBE9254467.1 type III-B CRISPR module RAMP protein Cmr4 [Synechocystis salina LEGE 00031]